MSKKSSERHRSKMIYFQYLRDTAKLVDPFVEDFIKKYGFGPGISDSMLKRYRFGAPQLRPVLPRLSYELCGGRDWAKIIPACGSLEVRDTAYYCYDDITDSQAGSELFLLANSFLTIANEMMLVLDNKRIMHEAFLLDRNNIRSGILEIKSKSFLGQIKKAKGFNFWENAFRMGAILSGATELQIKIIGEIGKYIGMAYIIANDTWDFGKSLEDFCNGRYTIPIIYALNGTNENDLKILQNFFGKKLNDKDKETIREIIVRSKSIEYGKNISLQFCKKAKSLLKKYFPQNPTSELILFSMSMTQKNRYFDILNRY